MWRFINYINAKYDYNVTKNKYYRRKIKIKYRISSYFHIIDVERKIDKMKYCSRNTHEKFHLVDKLWLLAHYLSVQHSPRYLGSVSWCPPRPLAFI